MKPTREQVLQWSLEAGAAKFVFSDKTPADQMHVVGKGLFEKLAALAYAAGAKEMQERCAKVCDEVGDGDEAPGDWPTPEQCAAAIRAIGDDDD